MMKNNFCPIVRAKIIPVSLCALLALACEAGPVFFPETRPEPGGPELMGYSIQTGAFSVLDNAVRMTGKLIGEGYDAFYFQHESGLFKVRMGDFPTYVQAERTARSLVENKIIADYYIVPPAERASVVGRTDTGNTLRDLLVRTAERYLSFPYTWGGENPEEGFDCSGLVLAVFRLHGLKLPRTSGEQFETGIPVPRSRLKKGDLVFFKTVPGAGVSHVGIYAGNGLFIHASSRNGTIRYDSLSSSYYSSCFAGACSYL